MLRSCLQFHLLSSKLFRYILDLKNIVLSCLVFSTSVAKRAAAWTRAMSLNVAFTSVNPNGRKRAFKGIQRSLIDRLKISKDIILVFLFLF